MEKQQQKRPKVPAHLLLQMEAGCGRRAVLEELAKERAEDKHGSRPVKFEINRAWAAMDQATLPEAHAALRWLTAEFGTENIRKVGGAFDLVDDSGEVLTSGPVGAVAVHPDGEVLVVSWVVGDRFDMPEPDEELGLVAAGLAECNGKPFRVAHVYLREGADGNMDAFPRRSEVFAPEAHQALWDRIRKAAAAPRDVACYGAKWCGHCRVNAHCGAWLARARVASATMATELVLKEDGAVEKAPDFELTPENVNSFAERLDLLESVVEFAKGLRNEYARKGGIIMLGGKQLVIGSCNGRKTVSADGLKCALAGLTVLLKQAEPNIAAVLEFVEGMAKLIKVGDPYEQPRWQAPNTVGGRR